ncbi:Asp23/Gls24 family envelope stress response protein [Dermatophilaceae bacterium Soc4.6]
MTDRSFAADQARGVVRSALAEPSERGRTVIARAVVEHIAVRAAADVEGVEPAGAGLEKVLGRRYPKANADVAGGRAGLRLDIAVAWPHPLADVCGQVRDTVMARVGELTGLRVDTVDVTAANVVHPAPDTPPRRVE